jgi:hypothetical protein
MYGGRQRLTSWGTVNPRPSVYIFKPWYCGSVAADFLLCDLKQARRKQTAHGCNQSDKLLPFREHVAYRTK